MFDSHSTLVDRLIKEAKLLHWDKQLAQWISSKLPNFPQPTFYFALLLLSRLVREKNTTLFLPEYNLKCQAMDLKELQLDSGQLNELMALHLDEDTNSVQPIVLRNRFLSLTRHARDVTEIGRHLHRLDKQIAIENPGEFQRLAERLFPRLPINEYKPKDSSLHHYPAQDPIDYQKLACCVGLLQQFFVLCGGPGTGKTSSAFKLLLLVSALFQKQHGREPIIHLAAPTGKAATRLAEAIAENKERFYDFSGSHCIPNQAQTLHRLLKIGRQNTSRYHQESPLPADILLVDEVSMIDNRMACQLLGALPSHCRLILLGDHHQLTSVEAGSLLSDLCQVGIFDHYSSDFRARLAALYPDFAANTKEEELSKIENDKTQLKQVYSDNICQLRKSYRFSAHSGIAWLASKLQSRQGFSEDDWIKANENFTDLKLKTCNKRHINLTIDALCDRLQALYQQPFELGLLPKFYAEVYLTQILSATRQGHFGCDAINDAVSAKLVHTFQLSTYHQHYHLQPILIEENDYSFGLYNGDLGLVIELADTATKQLVAAFPSEGKNFRFIPLSRLPKHSSAYAMTIHKSQGSEFLQCTLVLSESDEQEINSESGFIDRQLIYTGVTRAKQKLIVLADGRRLPNQIQREANIHSELALQLVKEREAQSPSAEPAIC